MVNGRDTVVVDGIILVIFPQIYRTEGHKQEKDIFLIVLSLRSYYHVSSDGDDFGSYERFFRFWKVINIYIWEKVLSSICTTP